jgi:CDP-paratose 2-epimerase
MRVLITGGAGFIGCNLADRLLRKGNDVTIFDNLSRPGTDKNLAWLRERNSHGFEFTKGDIRDSQAISRACDRKNVIYHLAAQTAVTTSVTDPRTDFDINAFGTFNVLEAARLCKSPPIVLYASTNKVYGGLEDLPAQEEATRYVIDDRPEGVDEAQPLDFHSPYGCSKGSADQYVRDYSRIYGLRTIVFRQSCIYGQRQLGVEDQGWVAWFVIAAVLGKPITIYGNGKQVRDLLQVDDLLNAYEAATDNIQKTVGQVYNVGGGPTNAISIWAEFGPVLEEFLGSPIKVNYKEWRPGDQPVYVSNCEKAFKDFQWRPSIEVRKGIADLIGWVGQNRSIFNGLF